MQPIFLCQLGVDPEALFQDELAQTLFFKFTAAPESVYIFSTLGVEPWGRIDSGIIELVASALPPVAKLVQSRGMYAFDSDVLVVIGKDWDISRVPVTPMTGE